MNGVLNVVFILVGYFGVSIALMIVVWRLSRRITFQFIRVLLRSATAAVLFAPTFFACGAASPVPFPLLLALDIHTVLFPPQGNSCGYQGVVIFNATIVLCTWVLISVASMMVIWIRRLIRRRTSNKPAQRRRAERPRAL